MAQLGDGRSQAVVEVHKGVSGPELLPQFLAGNEFSGVFEKQCENLKGLFLKLNLDSVLAYAVVSSWVKRGGVVLDPLLAWS